MTSITGLHRSPVAKVASAGGERPKPQPGPEYLEWLDEIWPGDTRELREGRYLHQQGNLRMAFERSDFWLEVSRRLSEWAHAYEHKTGGYLLFPGAPPLPALNNKPWESFLSRTWRQNVRYNDNWPAPPREGWWLPDNWFERAWDVVRMRFVVRYSDGVQSLAAQLVTCARALKLEADYEEKTEGFYAYQVGVRQQFSVDTLDYRGTNERSSVIELQVMTDLADVISRLTHPHYEVRREADIERTWQWDIKSEEAEANWLPSDLQRLEIEVTKQRDRMAQATPAAPAKRVPGTRMRRSRKRRG